ncbi:MAG: tetratricopeptide repeat protein [Verrucomicrobiae bacterium]|nr:tetratricopeptide repeat protein [Verrucomicrobiae bacterium]
MNKPLPILLAFSLLLPTALPAQAPRQITLEDCAMVTRDAKGRRLVRINPEAVDAYLEPVGSRIMPPPPRFRNAAEKKQALEILTPIIELLNTAVAASPNDPDTLLRAGYANGLGYHLQIEDCYEAANRNFERFLSIRPEHTGGNYLFGMFLATTREGKRKSIRYLEKASKDPEYDDALFTLGLMYVRVDRKDKALDCLNQYLKLHPNHEKTRQVIMAVETGNY